MKVFAFSFVLLSLLITINGQNDLYAPPANLREFAHQESYAEYDAMVRHWFNVSLFSEEPHHYDGRCTGIVYRLSGPENLQITGTFAMHPDSQTVPLSWSGFPGYILAENPNRFDAYKEADRPGYPPDRPRPGFENTRNQDEYCEWYTHRDPETGRIKKITITTELPEYYNFLFHNEPETLVRLYREYVSEEVELEDLTLSDNVRNPYTFEMGGYDHMNKWNTEFGIMHLVNPINNLREGVYISAQSTLSWSTCPPELEPVSIHPELSQCGRFSSSVGHADPIISQTINSVVRSPNNAIVSLANPIGVYIEKLQTDGWTDPFGFQLNPIDLFVTEERGEFDAATGVHRGLRMSITVPEGRGFDLHDVQIGGVPLGYAGAGYLIDTSVNVFLDALVSPLGLGNPEPVPCQSCWDQMPNFPYCPKRSGETKKRSFYKRGMKL